MNTDRTRDGQVAVLIDFENVGLGSIRWLFDQLSDLGRITIRRAYADWSASAGKRDQRQQRDQLLELGIEPIHLFHSVSGKNSSDIRLAIDAIELMYLSPVDTFVIVSSDTDFVPLVSKLRAAGKTVIGAGRAAAVSRTLVTSCDRYFFLDQHDSSNEGESVPTEIKTESLLVRAVKVTMDDQGRVTGSRLHETLQRLDPSFDYRALGFSTFTRYLEAQSEVNATRPRGPGDVEVELGEVSGPVPRRASPSRSRSSRQTPSRPPPAPSPEVPQVASQPPEPVPIPAPVSAQGGDPESGSDTQMFGPDIDAAWAKRATSPGQSFSGTTAANDAAKVLGASKLSESPHRTLQRLLDAFPYLKNAWLRRENRIIKK
jgi:uncharacterized protein (TIGR00288 family)